MTTESHVQLSSEDRAELEGWVAGRNTPQKLVWRARIVLMWADGAGITKIVQTTGKTKLTAYRSCVKPILPRKPCMLKEISIECA